VTGELLPVVSTEWLAARLGSTGLRVIDASWYLPGSSRNPAAEYVAGHIPGAVFFDLDASSDPSTTLPHMLPSEQSFSDRMASLGLNDADDLIVYDGSGTNLSAARVWWMLRTFGHHRSAVLDGGMGKWSRENRPIEPGTVALPRGKFTARLNLRAVRDLPAVQANIQHQREQLVDVRSAGRFAATEPEPRPGLRRGHVPGSRNLPFAELVQPDGTILPDYQLRRRIEAAGVDLSQPIVATCGSGTSACTLILSLAVLGHEGAALYDGAWSEWGGRPDTPIESGPPESRRGHNPGEQPSRR
jgi:thiosulfate/3-mercaptopyruvate sulfurtransferase